MSAVGAFVGGLARGADWAQNREIRGERHEMEKERYEADNARQARLGSVLKEMAADLEQATQPASAPAVQTAGLVPQDVVAPESAAGVGPVGVAGTGPQGVAGADALGEAGAAAPSPGAGLAPVQRQGPQSVEDQVAFGLFRNPRALSDPKLLDKWAAAFLKAELPEGVKWLERSHAAARENTIEATQLALAGDFRGAEAAFNRSGRRKVVPGSMKPTEDGKQVSVQFEDGTTNTFDPRSMMRSFLSPKDFFDLEHKEREGSERTRHQKRMEDIQSQYRSDWASIARENNEAKKLIAELKAKKEPTEQDWQKVGSNMRALIVKQMDQTAPVDEATKKKLPNPLAEFVPDIVAEAMKGARGGVNPELALEESYINHRTRLDEAERVLAPMFARAKKAGAGWFSSEKDAITSMQRDVNDLITQGMDLASIRRYVRATGRDVALFNKAYGSGAPSRGPSGGLAPRTGAAQAGGDKVHEPTTAAEVRALPKGARYLNPSDGEIYIKN